jgi:hypothetical protein
MKRHFQTHLATEEEDDWAVQRTGYARCIMPMTRSVTSLLFAGLLLMGAAACATAPPIPVKASRADIESLAGEWDGTYSSRDTGRSGSIWFKLIAGEDHAHGDVLMIPVGRLEPYYRHPPDGRWPVGEGPGATRVLTIRIAQLSVSLLDGRLDPYWDPDCHCEAVTVFRGRLSGDTLQGTFNTRLDFGRQASGRWVAHRRRSDMRREARHD